MTRSFDNWRPVDAWGYALRVAGLWALAVLCVAATGCEDSRMAETTHFEAAEDDYREGNYDDALSQYQAFLLRYPQSPLAPTAEMRIRSIHREVSSVMEVDDSLRPTYHGSDGRQSDPDIADDSVAPSTPPESAAPPSEDPGPADD